ncbi:hypothetical protein [Crocosphaera chwakensis]|uniref:Uncharacterized protein n=1 Tax=Crocosphaera chwakensis CCY0110 TaxID=391612 RepID=A3IUA2_9CHRO|nr:hypothetical protein [Crocosphaera chwakensis]EAZ89976.1 hypothetical protein CY0110_07264 [Crocosphaera chwakensis CCY0110]
MDTSNKSENRVQAYLSDSVYKAFREYYDTEGLNESKAMEKILSDFLLKKNQRCSIANNYQGKMKYLESRLSKVEAIIKTKDYLDREKVNTNSLKVTN